jgi:CDP-glycerol glycerophosphotransferase (TagB/SpsB family)
VLAAWPELVGRRVVLYAPTFRGRGRAKVGTGALDGSGLRAALPDDWAIVLKSHPNLDPATQPSDGFDVVADPADDMNDWLATADVFVTDYSSSIFEWALLRRPLVLLVPDLEEYERDPGLYLDYRTEMIGAQVADSAGVAAAVLTASVDDAAWDAFLARTMAACDGHASDRFVERFLPAPAARVDAATMTAGRNL